MTVSVVPLSASVTPTVAVAWSIPRRVGVAVTRNQIRRRLRSIVGDAHRADPLPPGAYVFHVDPPVAAMTYAGLCESMHQLLAAVRTSVKP